MKLGKTLKRLRLMKAATQAEIASLLNVERTTYAKWEMDKVVLKIDQADRIAAVYGIPLSYLIEFVEMAQIFNTNCVTQGIKKAELHFSKTGQLLMDGRNS